MIKFTIVTCTYNAASVLQRTLNSVLSQKYADIEHLILDGLSKDETVEMAMDYKLRSDKSDNGHDVTVVSEKDKGLYDAMNKGIRFATGDYVIFLNAGDGNGSGLDRRWRAIARCAVWRHRHRGHGRAFSASSQVEPSKETHMALFPMGHAGLSSGVLRADRPCQGNTI